MQLADSDLVVHEWGTVTSIAGKEGKAVDWLRFKGPVDLPGFVEHLRDGALKVGLRGTIRMETPVIYFHSSHEVRASVNVAFSRGVIDRKSTRLNSSHRCISYAVFCLKKKK